MHNELLTRHTSSASCAHARAAAHRGRDRNGGFAHTGDERLAGQQRVVAPTWARLADALRDGKPKGGIFAAGGFERYYGRAETADRFIAAMAAGSHAPGRALAEGFPWHRYRTVVDVGSAGGTLVTDIAARHPHLRAIGFDLGVVQPLFARNAAARGVAERVTFHAGDFLDDPLPCADVVLMGRVLHDWPEPTRRLLIGKAFEALPPGGVLVVWDAVIDDDRRSVGSLMSSLNMLVQTEGGSEYTSRECARWMRDAGFDEVTVLGLVGPYTALVATRPPLRGAAAVGEESQRSGRRSRYR